MSIFSRKKKFHFVGIGGVGMSGIAEILMHQGHQVSGSDRQKSELTDYLEKMGALIHEGHKAENLTDVDYLVYSSAISKTNPEMIEAETRNIPKIRRAEMLGQLMNRKLGVGVAGTHGKTTTTSMIGHVLVEAGVDPTIIVGGRLKNLMTNARLGSGDILVAEADEYDRSFLALFPRIGVITSLETDHLDIYSGLSDLKDTFVKFANQVNFDGSVILCADDENVMAIAAEIKRTVILYGFSEQAEYRADDVRYEGHCSIFNVKINNKTIDKFELMIPGEHNVRNALAVIAVCTELDVPISSIKVALKTFTGVDRRFEIKGIEKNIMVVDDYAHHPTEVRATLMSAKKGWNRHIVAVFQPHLYSRTRDFYREFAEVLALADEVVVTDVYPAREEKMPGVSGALITDELKRNGIKNLHYVEDKNQLPAILKDILKSNDMLITMGAGDIWQQGERVLKMLKAE
jgi:UDP-N-acetylmuramate--alanine ligase